MGGYVLDEQTVHKARRFLRKECDRCGAIYRIEEQSYPTKERGKIECEYCGKVVHEWNGGRMCYSETLSAPTREYKRDEE